MLCKLLFIFTCLWHVAVGIVLTLLWTSAEQTFYTQVFAGLVTGCTILIDYIYCSENKNISHSGMKIISIKTEFGTINYMERLQWGAAPSRTKMEDLRPTQPLKYALISHSVDEGQLDTMPKCCAVLRAMQRSAFAKGWSDVPYNYLVSDDGIIYEGRGSDYVSATCLGWNSHSIGIGFIGTYLEKKPSSVAINALQIFFNYLVHKAVLRPDFTVYCLGQVRANKFGQLLDSELYKEVQCMSSGNHYTWKWEEYEPQG